MIAIFLFHKIMYYINNAFMIMVFSKIYNKSNNRLPTMRIMRK